MNLHIWGASTLQSFTNAITEGFRLENPALVSSSPTHQDTRINADDFVLVQIHGSPSARKEDEALIENSRQLDYAKVFLIHRPDEAILNPRIKAHLEAEAATRFIFLGDLTFRESFWEQRRSLSIVIPHPQLELTLPNESQELTLGAFTAWGEMRNVQHYFSLIRAIGPESGFKFKIGGSGLEKIEIPAGIEIVKEPFVPHFNVQLYHLAGRKRYGESSGSLHRGVSVPVIFEANGAERLEGLRAIKIDADDDLKSIQFDRAAEEIRALKKTGFKEALENNLQMGKANSVSHFARAALNFMSL